MAIRTPYIFERGFSTNTMPMRFQHPPPTCLLSPRVVVRTLDAKHRERTCNREQLRRASVFLLLNYCQATVLNKAKFFVLIKNEAKKKVIVGWA